MNTKGRFSVDRVIGESMDIVELYEDEQFNNLLEIICERNKIYNFDDYRQDVFTEILNTGAKTMKTFRRAAQRIGMRYYRQEKEMDMAYLAYENENGEIETEDEVMGRLVYEGKARYVG